MKMILMAALLLSFSSAQAKTKIEACEKVAGRVAAQMFIGNLLMSLSDVTIKSSKAILENSDNAYRVTVREIMNEEHVDEVSSATYLVIANKDQSGLCDLLSVTKISK